MCGYYRFAHLDGRIPPNPAQYVRRPRVHPSTQRGMDRGELASFLYTAERVSPMHAALAVLLGLNGRKCSGSEFRSRIAVAVRRRLGSRVCR